MSIKYVVPLRPGGDKDQSPFQLYSMGFLEAVEAFKLIGPMPRDPFELVLKPGRIARERIICRGLKLFLGPTKILPEILKNLYRHIVVVVSSSLEIETAANSAISNCGFPVLHLRSFEQPFDRIKLRNHLATMASIWQEHPDQNNFGRLLGKVVAETRDEPEVVCASFVNLNHFVTQPNVTALHGVNCFQACDNILYEDRSTEKYFKYISDSAGVIKDIRRQVFEADGAAKQLCGTDLILAVPSVSKMWAGAIDEQKLPGSRKARKLLKHMLRQLVERKTFPFVIPPELTEPLRQGEPVIRTIFELKNIHRLELECTTAALAIRAASNFVPVVRLVASHNGAQDELNRLASARRTSIITSPHKMNGLVSKLSKRLAQDIPADILNTIGEAARIKIVSDAPLEWMEINGMPLMLAADVSRIPATPGDLCMQQLLTANEVIVPVDQFQQVLLVRSFADDDPVRPLCEEMLKRQAVNNPSFPAVRVVDVKNRQELVKALHEFAGAVMIFDGHGKYLKHHQQGKLVLSEDSVDPWTLRSEARVPPVVMLSACDTQPLDGWHWTSAAGFLASGALTVVGTAMPVDGAHSAKFVSRLLSRMGTDIVQLMARPWKSFRWSEILPRLQRSQFAWDAIMQLRGLGVIEMTDGEVDAELSEIYKSILVRGDWIGSLTECVGRFSRQPVSGMELLSKHCAFGESLAYVQLGNPEMIVGCDPHDTDREAGMMKMPAFELR